MFKKFVVLFLAILLVVPALAHAVKVKLPNGQEITVDGMSQHERNSLMDYLAKNDKSSTPAIPIPSTPAELQEWRQLITGTIKDVAGDLNVAVNEFVKTPAGLGVSALIIYKVAGKDMIEKAWSFFIIPLWFLITGLLGFVFFYLYKPVTVYEKKKVYEENGKTVTRYIGMKRGTRYPFASTDARGAGLAVIIALAVINTVVSMIIFF